MFRIAAGGFHHETNTFSQIKTTFADFEKADGWPPLCVGLDMIAKVNGVNIPIAGFLERAEFLGFEVKPLLWCSAQPAGVVTSDAFEKIIAMLLEQLKGAMPLDALFLDLHGAMVVENYDDGEAEIIKRVRSIVGNIPVFIALDFHANISDEMMQLADFMLPYKYYPHTDMAETGAKVCEALYAVLTNKIKLQGGHKKLEYLIPITSQCTLAEPAKTICAKIMEIERKYKAEAEFISLSVAYGFPPADVQFCGPSVIAYSTSSKIAEDAIGELYSLFSSMEKNFVGELLNVESSVMLALECNNKKPFILVDTQDNPGAGAAADGVEIVRELIRQNATNAIMATVFDPEVAMAAHTAGVGNNIVVSLGGKSGQTGTPLDAEFKVVAVGDGLFKGHGPMYGGANMMLGNTALLETGGVQVIVSSTKQQAGDRGIFFHLGIKPEDYKVIVLKSSVHFRADFDSVTEKIIFVEASGINIADPSKLPYRKIRKNVRLKSGS